MWRWFILTMLGATFAVRAQTQPSGVMAAVQIGLDRRDFSPGPIDGKPGSQTRAALMAWQEASGLPVTGELDAAAINALASHAGWTTNYVVRAEDLAELGHAPEDWRERSQQKSMAYETMRELLAERFHCTEEFLRGLNPGVTNWLAGTNVIVPAVEQGTPAKTANRLRVSLSEKYIRAYDADGKLIAHFPCSIAAKEEKRPVGELTVESIAANPNYTFDPENFPELDETQRGYGKLIIPPGPNNPVGTVWIGLSRPGYGIHGTPHPEQVGRTESHGCFRLANWNAERLMKMITIGTPVEVVK